MLRAGIKPFSHPLDHWPRRRRTLPPCNRNRSLMLRRLNNYGHWQNAEIPRTSMLWVRVTLSVTGSGKITPKLCSGFSALLSRATYYLKPHSGLITWPDEACRWIFPRRISGLTWRARAVIREVNYEWKCCPRRFRARTSWSSSNEPTNGFSSTTLLKSLERAIRQICARWAEPRRSLRPEGPPSDAPTALE